MGNLNLSSNYPNYQRLKDRIIQMSISNSSTGLDRSTTYKYAIENINLSKKELRNEICNENAKLFKSDEIRSSIESISWNYDDSKLAISNWKESIAIWNIKENQIEKKVKEFEFGKIAWHSKKNLLAFLSSHQCIKFYEIERDYCKYKIDLKKEEIPNKNFFICWHPKEDEVIAYNNNKNQIILRDIHNILKTIDSNFKEMKDLKWNFSGERIAFSGDNSLILWDFKEEKQFLQIKEKENSLDNINWSKDDRKICFLSSSKTIKRIKRWNIEEELEEIELDSVSELISIDWNSESKFILAGNKEKTFTLWDTENFIEIMSSQTDDDIKLVKWSNCGLSFAIQFKEYVSVHEWKTFVHHEPKNALSIQKIPEKIKWSPDSTKLLISYHDYSCEIWNSSLLKLEFTKDNFDSMIKDSIWKKTSDQIVWLTEDYFYFYNLSERKSLDKLEIDKDVHLIKYNNQSTLIAGAGNKEVVIISIDENGIQVKFTIPAHFRNVSDIRWSKDDSKLLSASRDGTIKLWNLSLNNGPPFYKLKYEIKKHIGYVHCAFWDQSENHIISAGNDQYIRIFKSENGCELRCLNMNDENMRSLNWLNVHDEKFIACLNSSENCIRVIDFKTNIQLKSIDFYSVKDQKKKIPINCMDVSPDGENIAIISEANVLIYDRSKIWINFDTYEYLYFLLDYLPRRKKINKENIGIVDRIVNCFFYTDAPSAFHILSIFGLEDEFDILIQFCRKHKIYPRKLFDTKNATTSLFKILIKKIRLSSIDLFFEFAIESDLQFGNFISLPCDELIKYTQKNSSKACKLLENRFRNYENDNYFAKWKVESIDSSISLFFAQNINDMIELDKCKFSNVEILTCANEDFEPNFDDSILFERPKFKILDIPLNDIALNYIDCISKSRSINEFCNSSLIISILDILWNNGVLNDFFKKNSYYFIYFLILIANSIVVLPKYLMELEENKKKEHTLCWILFLIFSILIFFLLIKFIYGEIFEWQKDKKGYWKSFWNYVDWINIIFSLYCNIFNILVLAERTNEYDWLRVFHSICFFFSMIRIFDFFRAFKKTCFLIEIVLQVVYDMKIFVFLMMLFVSTFSFSSKREKKK